MPDVPVYSLVVDQRRGRVFAATHGRGVYLLTEPFLMVYEGWVNGDIWDIPVYGEGFPVPGDRCTLEILLEDGTVCTAGTRDVIEGPRRGGEIRVSEDGEGRLTSGSTRTFAGRDVVWACFNGSCLGDPNNVPIESCDRTRPDGTSNRIAAIRVRCESGVFVTAPVGNCPQLANPPSTAFELGSGSGAGGDAGPMPEGGSFILLAAVQSGDGTTRTLCEAEVEIQPGRTEEAILQAVRDALNGNAECAAATVRAILQGVRDPLAPPMEDDPGDRPHLVLDAPGVVGGQLVTAIVAPPGRATGQCFRVSGLGVPSLGQMLITKIQFVTSSDGAQGGTVTVVENSNLGRCAVTVPTRPGDQPGDIAARLEAAFLGETSCSPSENPRDVARHGDMLVTVVARSLEVCVDDPGVGFAIAPEELDVPQLTPEVPPIPPIAKHQVGFFFGALLTDEDLPLTSSPEVGFRYGYRVLPRFTLEGELSLAVTEFEDDKGILARAQGHAALDLTGSAARIRPFIFGGGGIAHIDVDGRSDNAAVGVLGAGIKFMWRHDLGFRLDGRYIWLDELLGGDTSQNLEVTMGVSFVF
ncbi:MAG: hypothetical protein GWN77_02365 [Gammaproteobacteria bacterium]|nr:hypothetical protein [Gammaproteobacteria bacterium]